MESRRLKSSDIMLHFNILRLYIRFCEINYKILQHVSTISLLQDTVLIAEVLVNCVIWGCKIVSYDE